MRNAARTRLRLVSCASTALLCPFCTPAIAAPETPAMAAPETPAKAAEENKGIDIVVTARRQTEDLKDLPTSISVFNAADIEKRRLVDIADYVLQTPNVSLIEGGSRDSNSLSMRGVSNIGGSLNGSFALYVDQLNVVAFVTNPQLQDVERIEVLRGPQGTFFGRNAAGGAINITTREPARDFSVSGFVGAADHDSYEASGTVNLPVIGDRLYLRGTAYYYTTKGTIHNINPIGGTDFQHNLNLRLAAKLKVTDRLTIDASVTHANEESGLETGVPTGVLSINAIGFYGPTPDLTGIQAFPKNRTEVNENTPRRTDFRYTILNGRIHYEGDNVSFTSVTGVLRGRRSESGDGENTRRDAINFNTAYTRPIFSQEFRLASVGERRFKWTLGALYANEKYNLNFDVFTGAENPFGLPAKALVQGNDSFQRQTSYAAFGEFDFRIADRLTLTYGGRYTRDKNDAGTVFTSDFGPPVVNSANAATFSNFSSKFAARYDLTDKVSAYLLASQGYRAGGVQPAQTVVPAFKDETLWNYEAGVKGSLFNRHARFAASLYRIDWRDMQVTTFVQVLAPGSQVPVLITATQNAARARSTGAEFEIQARPVDALEFGFTAGYSDAKFEQFKNAAVPGANGPVDLSGRPLFNAPKWTLSANAQLNFKTFGLESFLRAEWSYRSSTFVSALPYVPTSQFPFPANFDFPYHVPSFGVWNVRAGFGNDKYHLVAYVENLFNRNYYTGTFDNIYASGVYVRVHPRRIGARLSFDFK
jgi:iron complex outermembrane receptor protein